MNKPITLIIDVISNKCKFSGLCLSISTENDRPSFWKEDGEAVSAARIFRSRFVGEGLNSMLRISGRFLR